MTATLPCIMLALAAALLGVAAARRGHWLHATCCGVAALLAVYVVLLVGLSGVTVLAAAAVPGRVPLDDPDGHWWLSPAQPACPDCDCCTARLCERGRRHPFRCISIATAADPAVRARIRVCPCSAETTSGTAAYAAAQVRAARRAEQKGGGSRG